MLGSANSDWLMTPTERQKSDEWKVSLKERKQSAKRVPPVGASANHTHEEHSARGSYRVSVCCATVTLTCYFSMQPSRVSLYPLLWSAVYITLDRSYIQL